MKIAPAALELPMAAPPPADQLRQAYDYYKQRGPACVHPV